MAVQCTFGPNDIQATPESTKEPRTLIKDPRDPVVRLARLAGGRLWQTESGRIVGEFPLGGTTDRMSLIWPNRAAAEAGLEL